MSSPDDLNVESHVAPASLAVLKPARRQLRKCLGVVGGVSRERRELMVLVFVELLTNAIEASRASDEVNYSFAWTDDQVTVRVRNANPYESALELRSMPEPYAESGRGLALAQQFADRVDIDSIGGQIAISAHFISGRSSTPIIDLFGKRRRRRRSREG